MRQLSCALPSVVFRRFTLMRCTAACQAENLKGSDRTTHPFARLMLAGECLHTSVMWQTTHPTWEEKIVFKCAH